MKKTGGRKSRDTLPLNPSGPLINRLKNFRIRFRFRRDIRDVIEYLSEIETKFENTLACLSGAQMGSNHEKNWRSKIS